MERMFETEAFSETGTEGTYWCLYDTSKSGYSGLVDLSQGDFLSIFNANNHLLWEGFIDKDTETNRVIYPYYSRFMESPTSEDFKRHLLKVNGLDSMPFKALPKHCQNLKHHILSMSVADCEKYIYQYHSQQLVNGLWVHWLQKGVNPLIWSNYFLTKHYAKLNSHIE